MIDILSDVIQVIVLSSRANALLGIDRSLQVSQRTNGLSQEQGLELVHASIGKQERGIVVWHTGRGRPEHVRVLLHEEIDKRRPDLVHRPLCV